MSSLPPHWSPTQSEMFAMCPERYRRRYVEGEVIAPGIALLRGSSVHKGAEINLKHKREHKVLLPLPAVLDAVRDEFEARWQGGVKLTPEESAIGMSATKGAAIDESVRAAQFHHEEIAPILRPALVEAKAETVVAGLPRPLLGFIDVVEEDGGIGDLKVTGKTPSDEAAANSVQLKHYALAYKIAKGKPSPRQRLDFLVSLKRGPKYVPVTTQNGPDDFARLLARYAAQMGAIDAGRFPPATPGAWWCSEKWCGFYQTCPYVRSPVSVVVPAAGSGAFEENIGEREEDESAE